MISVPVFGNDLTFSLRNSPYADRVLKVPVNKVQASFRREYFPFVDERRLLFPDGGFQPPARGSA